jgi:hypothetical protein
MDPSEQFTFRIIFSIAEIRAETQITVLAWFGYTLPTDMVG